MISLEQIQALRALSETGTFAGAADSLGKSYSSIQYLVRTLEEDLGLTLLDRNSYRTSLTPSGVSFLQGAMFFENAHQSLLDLSAQLKHGYEPSLQIVYDGIFSSTHLVQVLKHLRTDGINTKISTYVAFHEQVELEFRRQKAEFMISVTPPQFIDLPYVSLKPIIAYLVAAPEHPLVQSKRKIKMEELREYTLVTVRGSSFRLGLSTSELDKQSFFSVSDFLSKKDLIMEGLGFGWLPDYLIRNEKKRGKLKILNCEFPNIHKFSPKLYHSPLRQLGMASRAIVSKFQDLGW